MEEEDQPVSPTGQYFSSSSLSIAILAVFESEVPIDDSQAVALLQDLFLPINPRFSSIMVSDDNGLKRWRRVKVKLEEHVFVPTFPPGLSLRSYEERTRDYISKLSLEPLQHSRPLWEMHVLKYPTTSCSGTVVFKLHHALGDGFSLMGALFSCLRRADDPSLPLTFPGGYRHNNKPIAATATSRHMVMPTWFNILREFMWSLLKSNFVKDDPSPIHSFAACPGPESQPVAIASVMFPLESIRQIKAKLRGTVNDVIVGIIFYGIQLYVEKKKNIGQHENPMETTALVLLNTRSIKSYQTLKEMNDPGSKSPWGNQFGFLHVSIPKLLRASNTSPLDFVSKTREVIKRKRRSVAAIFLTGKLLDLLRRFKGPEAVAAYIRKTLRNTSMTISNLIGPVEQMQIAGHPIGSFYFMVVGVPQSLTISVVSYMGKLKVALGTEKDFIDSQLLVSCLENSFTRICEAALQTP